MATNLTINTDTISRMADALCAANEGLSKNAVLGAFAQAMMGPRAHWGALKSAKEPVVQPGLETRSNLPASRPEKLFLCAGSHDWSDFHFQELDEDRFRARFASEFDCEIEELNRDDKVKSCQILTIDLLTGKVEDYVASTDMVLPILERKAYRGDTHEVFNRENFFDDLEEISELKEDGFEENEYTALDAAIIEMVVKPRTATPSSETIILCEISLNDLAAWLAHDTPLIETFGNRMTPETRARLKGMDWYEQNILTIRFQRREA